MALLSAGTWPALPVQIYRVEDGELAGKIKVAGRINAIAFTTIADEECVITGSEDRTMAIWSPDEGQVEYGPQ
ncbi:hypothetical protein DFS34DRAFT_651425 [Phlyctochytrium arcticum]|nr:hypothetical protein DFS34DRAFT_651425 [Phlyctochytrium arcticum]